MKKKKKICVIKYLKTFRNLNQDLILPTYLAISSRQPIRFGGLIQTQESMSHLTLKNAKSPTYLFNFCQNFTFFFNFFKKSKK